MLIWYVAYDGYNQWFAETLSVSIILGGSAVNEVVKCREMKQAECPSADEGYTIRSNAPEQPLQGP